MRIATNEAQQSETGEAEWRERKINENVVKKCDNVENLFIHFQWNYLFESWEQRKEEKLFNFNVQFYSGLQEFRLVECSCLVPPWKQTWKGKLLLFSMRICWNWKSTKTLKWQLMMTPEESRVFLSFSFTSQQWTSRVDVTTLWSWIFFKLIFHCDFNSSRFYTKSSSVLNHFLRHL